MAKDEAERKTKAEADFGCQAEQLLYGMMNGRISEFLMLLRLG